MQPRRLILGSGSPYRAALLRRLGVAFSQRAPQVDESVHPGESAEDYVLRLAREKARAASVDEEDALVIGCDQAACLEERILGKPGDREAAVRQLLASSRRRVRFRVGLAILDTRTGNAEAALERLDVIFRALTRAEVERYVDHDQPWDCAGSFRAEGMGVTLFRALEGRDPNTLIGLPLIALCERLRAAGFALP
ncbi:Maf family protein [Arhodomonas sp. SL1]|uniref:Maf family protein n=1 Tax=Arhodomonas sp. SL1 TaxID=3425691 RepID=UPI003F881B93